MAADQFITLDSRVNLYFKSLQEKLQSVFPSQLELSYSYYQTNQNILNRTVNDIVDDLSSLLGDLNNYLYASSSFLNSDDNLLYLGLYNEILNEINLLTKRGFLGPQGTVGPTGPNGGIGRQGANRFTGSARSERRTW